MNLKNLRIVVDEREKKSGIPDLLKGIGINLEIKTLPIGDYIVAPETVVERKTISDLVSSIFDGRLFDQCNRLKEHYQFPILLIESNQLAQMRANLNSSIRLIQTSYDSIESVDI